ncbi:MAG: type II toxin-antitoxin system VapC family toxin [Chloroflexota bacterium]
MAQYLLDTNHVSPLVTLSHPLRDKVLTKIRAGDQFGLCVPVIAETLYGIGIISRANANLREWERLKPSFAIYGLTDEDAENAAYLQLLLRRKGWQLQTIDALIAVTALKYDLILLTTDKDFSRIEGLRFENWR